VAVGIETETSISQTTDWILHYKVNRGAVSMSCWQQTHLAGDADRAVLVLHPAEVMKVLADTWVWHNACDGVALALVNMLLAVGYVRV
jgi:hypothetical protein